MTENNYDLVVIGGGPGGYVAAIRAAQLGMHVACVEKRGTLGGTCLNVGCIPSKSLLHASEEFEKAGHHLEALGIKTGEVKLDLKTMMGAKDTVVGELTQGIEYLFKKNGIDYVKGAGRIASTDTVAVGDGNGSEQTLTAKNILIATGSEASQLPGLEIDEERIVTSTGALGLGKVPKHLVVIGAGVIGLELGSVWRRLGAEVTVIEFLDRITPEMDGEVSKTLRRILKKQGFDFKLSTKVIAATANKSGVTLTAESLKKGKTEEIKADVVLVSVGRKPYTEGLGLEQVGVDLDNHGRVVTDGHFRTSVPNIYAIGDVIVGPMLAHKAEDEGMVCAEIMAGQSGHINYDIIPGVIYTSPEVAAVGATEEKLKEDGIDYTVGKFPFTANARAKIVSGGEGFVKILADTATDRVLGVHIVGSDAGNMIGEAVLAMEYGASAEDIARTCHAHPTEMEALKEAALDVDERAIHI
jgi:dihydrolipoamide dehydrogenase